MVSIKPYLDDLKNVNYYIQSRNDISQKQIIKYYCAARCIQRWVRGYITRLHWKSLHNAATIIQKYWRGGEGRKYYRQVLEMRVSEISNVFYNQKAIIIQKTWRGHRVRKMTLHYYQYKKYLRRINNINEDILNKMNQYNQSLNAIERQIHDEVESKKKKKMLQELHPMLRTIVQPGIFSIYNTSELSEIEELIASVKMSKVKRIHPEVKELQVPKIGKLFQGPFLSYEEVLLRKNYELQPSLQASEPYTTEKQRMQENPDGFDK